MSMVDAEEWLGYMTAMMVMFCSSLPFYAQTWLPVKLPEHYLAVGGCAAPIAAHLYLWLPRAGLAFDAPSVAKAIVAFFAVFMIPQSRLCPQFVYDMNFSDGKKLDELHIFIMRPRGFGMLGLFFLGLLAHLDAEKFLPLMTKWACAITAAMPVVRPVFLGSTRAAKRREIPALMTKWACAITAAMPVVRRGL